MVLSLRKTFLVAVIFTLAAGTAQAATLDYLLISLAYDSAKPEDQAFEVIDVEQRVIEQTEIQSAETGTYKLSLLNGDSEIAKEFFAVIKRGENDIYEVVGSDGESFAEMPAPSRQVFTIPVLLTGNISVSDSILQISNSENNQVLLSKRLDDIPLQISQAKEFNLLQPEEPFPTLPAFHEEKNKNWLWIDLIALVVLAAIVASIVWAIKAIRRKIKSHNETPPAETGD